ncbi:AAA ATPase [Clydaea vesicula]|uniref:Cell division control protein n=1 Tax=Clydaea vesicula TaxID=447962 RepID=A0AAD5UBX4_9FUNG|nr:AAA ATPase [Clydaea vesicula]
MINASTPRRSARISNTANRKVLGVAPLHDLNNVSNSSSVADCKFLKRMRSSSEEESKDDSGSMQNRALKLKKAKTGEVSKESSDTELDKENLNDEEQNGNLSDASTAFRASLENIKTPQRRKALLVATPKTPSTPKTPLQFINEAKSAFKRCSTPKKLVGRVEERKFLENFITEHIVKGENGSLYLSGCPGTGKTALLDEVLFNSMKKIEKPRKYKIKFCKFNCMALKDPKYIFKIILKDFRKIKDLDSFNIKECIDILSGIFISTDNNQCSNAKSNSFLKKLMSESKAHLKESVIILDEIDYLLTKDQEVLYKLFEWASHESSKLVLIGIANALDMTGRFLPRLRAKNMEPKLLNFKPYEINEISDIIKDRLMRLYDFDPGDNKRDVANFPLMQDSAIEFCARKLVGIGDLRKALDVCRQSIEILECEYKKENCNEDHGNKFLSLQDVPKVTLRHVSKVTSEVLGNSSTGVMKVKNLHLHQKILLIAAVILEGEKKSELSISKLQEEYFNLCRSSKNNLPPPVSRSEFQDLVNLLEALSLIKIVLNFNKLSYKSICPGSSIRDKSKKFFLNIHPSEVMRGCQDMKILEEVLKTCNV